MHSKFSDPPYVQVSASIALNSIFLHGFQVGRSTTWLPLPSWLIQDIEYRLNYEGGFQRLCVAQKEPGGEKGKSAASCQTSAHDGYFR